MTQVPYDAFPTTGSTSAARHQSSVAYPQLDLSVFIVGDCFLSGAIELFARAGCRAAKDVEASDLVVFLGGEDVDPDLYGEWPLRETYWNRARDEAEMDVFTECLQLGKPSFGICRGFQFLAVMNGSKLHQNVYNHGRSHDIIDRAGVVVKASSMHHQMVIYDDSFEAVAWAAADGHSGTYEGPSTVLTSKQHRDLEAAIFPNIDALGVQGHPEVGGNEAYSAWCLGFVKDFLDERHRAIGSNSRGTGELDLTTINPDLPFLKRGVDV